MDKDLEFSVTAVFSGYYGDDLCCLGDDEHVGGQGGGL